MIYLLAVIRRREGGRSAGEGQEGDFFELEVCYMKCLFLVCL